MTFSILNTTTNKVVSRSNIRALGEPTLPYLRIDPLTTPDVVTSHYPPSNYLKDNEESHAVTEEESHNVSASFPKHNITILYPNDLVGRTFLIPE